LPLLKMLTINEEDIDSEGVLEIIWRALEYFPRGLWDGAEYLGNINIRHDVKIKFKEVVYGAFILNNLMEKIRRVRKLLGIDDLLLAITYDPVITVYHRFEAKKINCFANLIYDYVSRDVGLISFFRVKEGEIASKIIAHGLGHSRGLRHHLKPVDIMYEGLIEIGKLRNDGFCSDCIKKISCDMESSRSGP